MERNHSQAEYVNELELDEVTTDDEALKQDPTTVKDIDVPDTHEADAYSDLERAIHGEQ